MHLRAKSFFAEHNFLYLRRIRQHCDHNFRFRSDFRIVRRVSAESRHRVNMLLMVIHDIEVMSCLCQVDRHRLSHNSKSDKADFHNSSVSFPVIR